MMDRFGCWGRAGRKRSIGRMGSVVEFGAGRRRGNRKGRIE